MKLYTYSTARQRLAEVLEEASREGDQSAQSPFANVTGLPVKGVTSKDLLRTVREEGWARGGRALRGARASRAARGKRRTG
jgi:hypothetical protein